MVWDPGMDLDRCVLFGSLDTLSLRTEFIEDHELFPIS